MKFTNNYIAYYRVSTAKQGKSGLGLEAQRHAVRSYLAAASGSILAEYVEIESGRRKERQELRMAINHARVTRSKLIIAKLDRLARSVSFTAALMESGVEFVACDLPQANRFTIHVMAALAEMEAEMISSRTKAALLEAKRRGVKLGNPRLSELRGNPDVASKANSEQARRRAQSYLGLVAQAKAEGAITLQGIADYLNRAGALTPKGSSWRAGSVSRLIKYLGL